jgi:hypothetical protein
MSLFFILLVLYTGFVLWLGSIILNKAGIAKGWVLCLLIPIINIIMLWVFAFSHWPGVHPSQPDNTLTHDQ